jgi:hypothetical protein
VLGVVAMTERVADDRIGEHAGVPRLGEPEQAVVTAGGVVQTAHAARMPRDAQLGVQAAFS